MAAEKTSPPYKKAQFTLPVRVAADLVAITDDLRAESREAGTRAVTMSEIVTDGLRREIRRQRKALDKRRERAEV